MVDAHFSLSGLRHGKDSCLNLFPTNDVIWIPLILVEMVARAHDQQVLPRSAMRTVWLTYVKYPYCLLLLISESIQGRCPKS
jgi:hypothetical protein